MTEEKKSQSMSALQVVGAIIGAGVVIYLIYGNRLFGGAPSMAQPAQSIMDNISQQVAADQIQQYEMVKRNSGTKIEICGQASIIAAAYLNAKDEPNYRKWKDIERADCKAAGM